MPDSESPRTAADNQPTPAQLGYPSVGYFCECGRLLEYDNGIWGCGACGTTVDMRATYAGVLELFSESATSVPAVESVVGAKVV